jgi:hypothetical protein
MNTRTPRIDGIDPNRDWYREGKKNRELAIFCEVLSRELVSILKEPASRRLRRGRRGVRRAPNQRPAEPNDAAARAVASLLACC